MVHDNQTNNPQTAHPVALPFRNHYPRMFTRTAPRNSDFLEPTHRLQCYKRTASPNSRHSRITTQALFNRQPARLEITATRRKQTLAALFNRQLFRCLRRRNTAATLEPRFNSSQIPQTPIPLRESLPSCAAVSPRAKIVCSRSLAIFAKRRDQ